MTRSTPVVGALAVACVTAVAATSATPPLLTQASSGKTIRLMKGGSATLRLSNRWRWSEPHAITDAVELTPVEYFVDPGFREWTIDARRPGRATIRSLGRPNCSSCAVKERSFRLAVVVAPR